MISVGESATSRPGAKAAALARLGDVPGIRIPAWFVVHAPRVPERVDTPERLGEWIRTDPAAAATLAAARAAACEMAGPRASFAVRSSAEGEDGLRDSHAGVFLTRLNVADRDLGAAILEVWLSGLAPRVAAYRRARGLPPIRGPIVAIVQRMVASETAGVAFLRDDSSAGPGDVVIGAARGLGAGVVDGTAPTALYEVRGDLVVRASPSARAGEGELSPTEARAIAALTRASSEAMGAPQDLEWAIAEGRVYVLQTRPLTAPLVARARCGWALWVNSNTASNYPGVLSPLTASMAVRTQTEILRQSARLLWFPGRSLAAGEPYLGSLFELFSGRLYFDRVSWYRFQAAMGGFAGDRGEVERALRADDLPDELVEELLRSRDEAATAGAVTRLRGRAIRASHGYTVGARVRAFFARVERTVAAVDARLRRASPRELADLFRGVERDLLRRWDGILVNDFLAMSLRDRLVRAAGDEADAVNDALASVGAVRSAEAASALEQLAVRAAASPALAASLASGSDRDVVGAAAADAGFSDAWRAYVDEFGDVAAEELKLESPTVRDRPAPALRRVGVRAQALARAGAGPRATGAPLRPERAPFARRRPLLALAVRRARARMRDRENLRLARARVYASLRRLFRALGRGLCELGALADESDVFYLTVEEALDCADGRLDAETARALVARRRADETLSRSAPEPPVRFFAHRSAPARFASVAPAPSRSDAERRQGVGCSSGAARGPARGPTEDALRDPTRPPVLVAAHADPNLTAFLPAAAGVVVEAGSPFCHLAIVARELSIPMVCGVPGVARLAESGAWIELDGRTGEVRVSGLGPERTAS